MKRARTAAVTAIIATLAVVASLTAVSAAAAGSGAKGSQSRRRLSVIRHKVAGAMLASLLALVTLTVPVMAQTVPAVHVSEFSGIYSRTTGVLAWTVCTVDQTSGPVAGVSFNGGIVLNVKGVAFNSGWPSGATGSNGCLQTSVPLNLIGHPDAGQILCNFCGLVIFDVLPPAGYLYDATANTVPTSSGLVRSTVRLVL
jgi:hypothetical protein